MDNNGLRLVSGVKKTRLAARLGEHRVEIQNAREEGPLRTREAGGSISPAAKKNQIKTYHYISRVFSQIKINYKTKKLNSQHMAVVVRQEKVTLAVLQKAQALVHPNGCPPSHMRARHKRREPLPEQHGDFHILHDNATR